MELQIYIGEVCSSAPKKKLYLVPNQIAEELWSNTDKDKWGETKEDDYLIPGAVKKLSPYVIDKPEGCWSFLAPRARIKRQGKKFVLDLSEGRHRMRWLLDKQVKLVPMEISADSRVLIELGLDKYRAKSIIMLELPLLLSEVENMFLKRKDRVHDQNPLPIDLN